MDPVTAGGTNTTPSPGASGARSMKAMWATIGALAVAVVALGGVLLHQNSASEAPAAAPPVAALAPVRAPDDFKPPVVAAAPVAPAPEPQAAAPAPVQAPVPVPVPVPAQAPAVVQAPAPTPYAQAPAPRPVPVCKTCGRVESVRPVQVQQPASGVGAVAGGVLGGVLGHQIGNGNGRTAATVLGAVGGGFAGNEVEKRVHTKTVYEVGVRMRDGSLRHVQTASAPPVGKPVTLQNGVLRPADGQP